LFLVVVGENGLFETLWQDVGVLDLVEVWKKGGRDAEEAITQL
jgi:hypothetical protein